MNHIDKIIDYLSFELFSEYPDLYLNYLKQLRSHSLTQEQKQILYTKMNNNTVLMIHKNPPLTWVVIAAGKFKTHYRYAHINTQLSNELAIELFDLMILFGADLNTTDIYGHTVIDYLQDYKTKVCFYGCRHENESFLEHARSVCNI